MPRSALAQLLWGAHIPEHCILGTTISVRRCGHQCDHAQVTGSAMSRNTGTAREIHAIILVWWPLQPYGCEYFTRFWNEIGVHDRTFSTAMAVAEPAGSRVGEKERRPEFKSGVLCVHGLASRLCWQMGARTQVMRAGLKNGGCSLEARSNGRQALRRGAQGAQWRCGRPGICECLSAACAAQQERARYIYRDYKRASRLWFRDMKGGSVALQR